MERAWVVNLNSSERWILEDILQCIQRSKLPRTKVEYAQEIGRSKSDPLFQRVMKHLMYYNIATIVEIEGNCKRIKIQERLLCDFIDDQEIAQQEFDSLKRRGHIVSWKPAF